MSSSIAPVEAPARTVIDPSELDGIDPVDWVLVGVKAHQTQDAAPWFDRLCGPSTSVVVMQNGVEGEERLRPYVHGAEVVAAVVYCGAELTAPGRIRHTNAGTLIVPSGRSVSERLAELFAGSGARIKLSDDYVNEAWRKLGINVLANGITALTRQTMGVLRRPEVAQLAERLLDECWTVARADGASLSTDDVTAGHGRRRPHAGRGRDIDVLRPHGGTPDRARRAVRRGRPRRGAARDPHTLRRDGRRAPRRR